MDDVDLLRDLLIAKHERLRILLVQAERFGPNYVPPHIAIEIDHLRPEVADLEEKLQAAGIDPADVVAYLPPLSPTFQALLAAAPPIDPERAKLILLVTNLLDQSEEDFERMIDLDLGLSTMPRLVAPVRGFSRGAIRESRPLDVPILDRFLRDQRLLIIGAPGAGKSATIRQLCRDLLPLARTGQVPVPIIVNLASYGQRGGPIDRWLIERGLPDSLGIAKKIAAQLLGDGTILLLLDGLDEMVVERRADCIEAINAAIAAGDRWTTWLVVGCRRQDYDEAGVALAADTALEVQSVTFEDVKAALQVAGKSTRGLRAALAADANLADMLITPLAITLAMRAYAGTSVVQILGRTAEERWRALYHDFMRQMLGHGRSRHRYPAAMMLYWLRWLARTMCDQTMTVFLVERLRPTWLRTRRSRFTYQLVGGLGLWLSFGLSFGLVAGLGFGLGFGLFVVLVVGLGVGLLFGLVDGLFGGLGYMQPVERMTWEWAGLHKHISEVLVGALGMGLIVGLVVGMVAGPYSGSGFGLGVGLVVGLILGLSEGFVARIVDAPISPNGGMWASLRNGLIQILIIGLVGGLGFGLISGSGLGVAFGLISSLYSGLGGGLGAFIQHFALRLALWLEGSAPLNYVRFLESCRAMLFLRRRGGAYEFWHITLRDYLANLTDDEIAALAKDIDD